MKIYLLKLALIGILIDFIDHISTWYMVNYLDIGIYEGNPHFRDEFGRLDMETSNVALLIVVSIYIVFAILLLKRGTFPSRRAYKTLGEVEKDHRRFTLILFILMALILNQGSVVFIWNPLADLGLISSAYFPLYKSASLVICSLATIFWALAVLWRYLTPEAQESHRYKKYLQWPYKAGLLRDII